MRRGLDFFLSRLLLHSTLLLLLLCIFCVYIENCVSLFRAIAQVTHLLKSKSVVSSFRQIERRISVGDVCKSSSRELQHKIVHIPELENHNKRLSHPRLQTARQQDPLPSTTPSRTKPHCPPNLPPHHKNGRPTRSSFLEALLSRSPPG